MDGRRRLEESRRPQQTPRAGAHSRRQEQAPTADVKSRRPQQAPTAGAHSRRTALTQGGNAKHKNLGQLVGQRLSDNVLDVNGSSGRNIGRIARNLKVGHGLARRPAGRERREEVGRREDGPAANSGHGVGLRGAP